MGLFGRKPDYKEVSKIVGKMRELAEQNASKAIELHRFGNREEAKEFFLDAIEKYIKASEIIKDLVKYLDDKEIVKSIAILRIQLLSRAYKLIWYVSQDERVAKEKEMVSEELNDAYASYASLNGLYVGY
ncbi:MAG: hypothetical protein QXL16_00660 [Candidatus Micrarchaeaceae archaeon]